MNINTICIQLQTQYHVLFQVSLVEKKGELKDAQNALSKDFDVLCLGPCVVRAGTGQPNPPG